MQLLTGRDSRWRIMAQAL